MSGSLDTFNQIWLVDFEFSQPEGERPLPICLVAREFRRGQLFRLFGDELCLDGPPFSVGSDALFVAYYASAEIGCFFALGWPPPTRVLDLYAEFRCHTSGLPVSCGHGLLGALAYFGLDGIESAEKETMRQLAMRGGPFSAEEKVALLDYCQSDVDAMARLLPAILPFLDVPRALLRGRYMIAAARMERHGTPIDLPLFLRLKANWQAVQSALIRRMDIGGVWEGPTFHAERFAAFLQRHDIPWPRLKSGALSLDDRTFRTMAKAFPVLWPIRELRHTLSELRLNALAVGEDGRNRCMLSAFGSKTSRNQPSNSRFIFGPSVWLRGLIKPTEGRAIAYVDWEQQEFGIAAALSRDRAMMEAYTTGDPYLTFAKQAGAVPSDATKQSHPKERERFKVCSLGVQYGMSEQSLAMVLGESESAARELLRAYRQTYRTFWQWSDAAMAHAMLRGELFTVFDWRVHVTADVNPRSLRNFPMQANAAEMLRLACCLATEGGIMVCAPIHDAVLIEAAVEEVDAVVNACQMAMREASEIVLSGFRLRTEARIFCYPERYEDERGREMWATVLDLLNDIETAHSSDTLPVLEVGNYPDGSGIPASFNVCYQV